MLLELIVAGAMLGTLLVVCLQMLSAAAANRRMAAERQCAIGELGNVMERITTRSWTQLTPAAVAGERVSSEAAKQLPDAELKIDISESAARPNAKRIAASLLWRDRNGKPGTPLTLTTWRYRTAE
jgi:hypothetical protein